MNILITGGAGFIGSHLVDFLLNDKGHKVCVVDDLSTGQKSNLAYHLNSCSRFTFVEGNVCSKKLLEPLVKTADIVFHLAAAVGVKLIVENPIHTIETNILGTHTLLKLAARYNKKVILASTSEVYGKNTRIPFKEDADLVLGPTFKHRWSYACSKAIDEFLALAYQAENKIPVVIVRFFNTIGPRQSGQYGMVVPRFIHQALHEEPITVYDNGEQARCFGYVKDAVRAIFELSLNKKAEGGIFNVGSTERVTINHLAGLVKKLASSSSEILYIPYDKVYGSGFEDIQDRIPDTSALKNMIGWAPKTSLESIVHEMILYEKGRI